MSANDCHPCREDRGLACSPGARPPVILCAGESCARCDYASAEADAPAPFEDRRTSCACGDQTLAEGEVAVPDPVDERFLHSPALCFVLTDDEATR